MQQIVAYRDVEKEPGQTLRVLRYTPGCAGELLGRCRHFEVYRMLVNTERKQKAEFRADELSFRVFLCIDGCGMLFLRIPCWKCIRETAFLCRLILL